MSVLYAVYCKGYAKIGIASDIVSRISTLQCGCPFPYVLLATWRVPSERVAAAERAAMLILDDQHYFSDWFKCSRGAAIYAVRKAAVDAGGSPYSIAEAKAARPRTSRVRGEWSRIAVITPQGCFRSLTDAAKAIGISHQAISQKCKKQLPGWRFDDEETRRNAGLPPATSGTPSARPGG